MAKNHEPEVIGPETWEEESAPLTAMSFMLRDISSKLWKAAEHVSGIFAKDEEEDFPFKDWVGHLGERTLRGPFSSKKQQEVSQWLLDAWPSMVERLAMLN